MKNYITLFLLFVIALQSRATNSLVINKPSSWSSYTGTIEHASISVGRKGLFVEHSLFLTFSARGSNYTANDTLEITYRFDLPQQAMVTDSWLWIGENISQGIILDRWTASTIYENIVNRRKDPSILTKDGATQYTLKVYPMRGNETRKVKITYLLPATWSGSSVSTELPTALLKVSFKALAALEVLVKPSISAMQPKIMGYPGDGFTDHPNASEFPGYKHLYLGSSFFNTSIILNFDSPLKNGYLLSHLETAPDEGYYQLAYLPGQLVPEKQSKKLAILIDYDKNHSGMTKENISQTVREKLLLNLSEKDSFNVIISQPTPYQLSAEWLPASSPDIEQAAQAISTYLASYSNLASVLSTGVNFIKSKGGTGEILLIANSQSFTNYQAANDLIKDLMTQMKEKAIPFNITDFNTVAYSTTYLNGRNYTGNEYLYLNLAQQTNGILMRSLDKNPQLSLGQLMDNAISAVTEEIQFLELQLNLGNGFSYGRYALNPGTSTYLNTPYMQIGRYKGNMSFTLTASGQYQGEYYSATTSLASVSELDTTTICAWNGLRIRELESGAQTNATVNSIIDLSVENRVLSKYTAFLCLEDSIYYCYDCKDETTTGISEINRDSLLTAYPNPFVDEVEISVLTDGITSLDDIELQITDNLGRDVYRVPGSMFFKDGAKYIYRWNPSVAGLSLDAGVYYILVSTPEGIKTLKLLKQ